MHKLFALITLCAFGALTCSPAAAEYNADLSLTRSLPHPVAGGSAWTPAQIAALKRDINKLLAGSALRGADVGLVVQDTVRGTTLFSLNGDHSLQPASNFKLLVGSASLDKLGTAFAFHTQVAAAGTVANGTLDGNLYLQGGGDLHLTAKDLDAAAAAVAAAGIKHVTGSVVGDARRYDDERYPDGWDLDDLPYYYATPVTALSIDENVGHIRMIPGKAVGDPVGLDITAPSTVYAIDNRMTTGPATSRDTSNFLRPWDQPRTVVLTGTYPLGAKESGDLSPALPDPAAYAVDVFAQALAAHGVTVDGAELPAGGATPAGATVLWAHASEPMPQLMADFWWPSDNIQAEIFLKELSVADGAATGNDRDGARDERAWLTSIGVDPSTVSISDGSGLSNYDRITPHDLVTILQHDWNGPNRNTVLEALPVAGVVGSLRRSFRGTPAEKNVWAKTGSINHVRTISGFLRTAHHGAVTFSFMVNDWMGENQPKGAAALAILRGAVLSRIISD